MNWGHSVVKPRLQQGFLTRAGAEELAWHWVSTRRCEYGGSSHMVAGKEGCGKPVQAQALPISRLSYRAHGVWQRRAVRALGPVATAHNPSRKVGGG